MTTGFKGKGAHSLSYEREMRRNLFWCVPYRRPSAPSNILLSINFLPGDKCSYNQGLKICKSDREKQEDKWHLKVHAPIYIIK